MDFTLSPEHQAIHESIARFAREQLQPIAAQIDEEERFPIEVYRKLAQNGFLGAAFPEEYGGGGGDLLANAIIKEEVSAVCPGFAVSMGVSAIFFAYNILEFGTEEQKRRYIPPILAGEKMGCWCLTEPGAGSDALALTTRAVRDGNGYRLSGTKTFITNAPLADYFLVAARTGDPPKPGAARGAAIEGGTLFVLEKGAPGLSVGKPFHKLGMRCSPTSEVFLDEVAAGPEQVVGREGEGFRNMMRALDTERVTAPFTSIGIARACLETARDYAQTRKQFGRALSDFQLIKEKLADMAIGIALARTYSYRVVWMKMQGQSITFEVAMAKRFAAQMAARAASEAVQILGGYGFIKEYNVERFYRDVKLTEIGAGTNEIQTVIIARELLKGKNP